MIRDKFSNATSRNGKRFSRQTRYRLRRKAEGRCQKCGQPEESSGYCHRHLLMHQAMSRRAMEKQLASGRAPRMPKKQANPIRDKPKFIRLRSGDPSNLFTEIIAENQNLAELAKPRLRKAWRG